MIELNGHLISLKDVSYVSPVQEDTSFSYISYFRIVVDGTHVLSEYQGEESRPTAVADRERLVKAVMEARA